jgi:hypothetical protein
MSAVGAIEEMMKCWVVPLVYTYLSVSSLGLWVANLLCAFFSCSFHALGILRTVDPTGLHDLRIKGCT